MRRYTSTILIVTSLFIGEVHTFWERRPVEVQNWIYAKPTPMSVQWNVKFAASELSYLLLALALLLYTPNRVNKSTATALVCFAAFNILAYFYNYKTFDYGLLYIVFIIAWIISFFRHKNSNLIR